MKKNQTKKRVGFVAVMLMLVIAICATAGTTLAKYVSSFETVSNNATVAKWGYTMTVNESKMFSKQYGEVNTTTNLAKISDSAVVVKSSTENNVVAPGTTGSMSFTLFGSADVDAELKLTIANGTDDFKTVKLAKSAEDSSAYYPIKWAVDANLANDGTPAWSTTDVTEVKDLANLFKTALNSKISGATVGVDKTNSNVLIIKLPAGTDLGTTGLKVTISWKWDFETTKTPDGNYNAEDTLLGYLAAGKTYTDISNVNELNGTGKLLGDKTTGSETFTAYKTNSVLDVKLGLTAQFVQVQAWTELAA